MKPFLRETIVYFSDEIGLESDVPRTVVELKPSSNFSLFFLASLDLDSLGNDLCSRESLPVRKWNFSTFAPGFLSGPRLNPKLCAFFRN